jgi:uncharacterized repeat protein (TIGR02543 family)
MLIVSLSVIFMGASAAAATTDATADDAATASSPLTEDAATASSPMTEDAAVTDASATAEAATDEGLSAQAETSLTDEGLSPQSSSVYFVDGTKKDNGTGTAADPFNNMESALTALKGADGTIYVAGKVTLTKSATWLANEGQKVTIARASTDAGGVADYRGQMVTMAGADSTLTMSGLTWDGASSASDVSSDGGIGIEASGTTLSATGCDFKDFYVSASSGTARFGGAIGAYGSGKYSTISLDGCTFDGCAAPFGGAVFSYGNVSVKGCKFKGCTATTSAVNGGGGAIWAGEPSSATYGSLSVDSTTFDGCTAPSAGGGAICMEGADDRTLTVSDSAFSSCSSANWGGGICASSGNVMTVTGSTFSDCSSKDGGGIFGGGASLSVTEGCSFDSCAATRNGGAINASSTLVLGAENGKSTPDVVITDCSAASSGGGLYLSTTSIKLTDLLVKGCAATSGEGRGGGLYSYKTTEGADQLVASNVTFEGNSALSYGGGAYAFGGTWTKCTFADNSSTNYCGGAFETNGMQTLFDGCSFTGNTAVNGGAIDVNRTSGTGVTLKGCSLKYNKALAANGDGGAISMRSYVGNKPTVHLSGATTMMYNQCGANGYGGAIAESTANGMLYVSGEIVISDNHTSTGKTANVGIPNTAGALTNYKVYVEGSGLTANSSIGLCTNNVTGSLAVAGSSATGSSYILTDTNQLSYFKHDNLTRGDDSALMLVWSPGSSPATGTGTYVLGGSPYRIEYWFGDGTNYVERTSERKQKIDPTGTVFSADDIASMESRTFYGYALAGTLAIEYSVDDGGTWNALEAGATLPSTTTNDQYRIRVKYDRIINKVSFKSDETGGGEVTNGADQSVPTGGKAAAGVGTSTATDWFFIGWHYVMATGGGTTSGYAYDYTTVTIEGATTFTAMFAKQPFVSVMTDGGGSVAVDKDAAVPDVVDGTLSDSVEWPKGTAETYGATIAMRADAHHHIKSITVIRPAETGDNSTTIDLTNTATAQVLAPDVTAGATAKLSLSGTSTGSTYGTLAIEGLPQAASVVVDYEADPTYSVRFYSYDGSTTTPFYTHSGLYDGEAIGNAPTGVPTRAGYNFMGWTSDPTNPDPDSGARPDYDPGKLIDGADQTYYALWQEIGTKSYIYDVEIYTQDVGSTDADDKTQYTLDSATSISIYSAGGTVTEAHPTLVGYEYNSTISNDSGKVTTEPILTLRLYYKRNGPYKLSLKEADGTTDVAGLTTPQGRSYGEALGLSLAENTPAKAGYTFVGWYYEPEFVTKVPDDTLMPDHDLTVYARWSADARPATIKVTKTTSGDYADKTRGFSFSLTYMKLNEDKTTTQATETHTLADGDSFTVTDAAQGTTYSVTETKDADYAVSEEHTVPAGGSATESTDGDGNLTVSGTVAYGTTEVDYTNTYTSPAATGISLGSDSWWIPIAVVATVAWLVFDLRRRRKDR